MKKKLKRKLIVIFIFISALLIGFGGYKLYNYIVDDITRKVRKSASRAVVDALNPFAWPGKILGGKKDKSND